MIVEDRCRERSAGFALLKLGGFIEIDGKRCVKTSPGSYVVIEGNERQIAELAPFSSLKNGAAFQYGAWHLIKTAVGGAVYLDSGVLASIAPDQLVVALPHAKVVLEEAAGESPF